MIIFEVEKPHLNIPIDLSSTNNSRIKEGSRPQKILLPQLELLA